MNKIIFANNPLDRMSGLEAIKTGKKQIYWTMKHVLLFFTRETIDTREQ